MPRVLPALVCIVALLVLVGPVSAQPSHTVFVPLVTENVRVITTDVLIEHLIAADAVAYSFPPHPADPVMVGRFSLNCVDPESLASPANTLRDGSSPYGSADSPYSAMNPSAPIPPIVFEVVDAQYQGVAPLTANGTLAPRIAPDRALAYLAARGGCD